MEHDADGGDATDGALQPPQSSFDTVHRSEYGGRILLPKRPSSKEPDQLTKSEANGCAVDELALLRDGELAARIQKERTSCINGLFDLRGTRAGQLFDEDNMVAIANALGAESAGFADGNPGDLVQLILFLRAGYYVQFHDTESVGGYGPDLRSATQDALDSLFSDREARVVANDNGEALAEAVTLIDSAELNAEFLDVVERLWADYDKSFNSSAWMLAAVNNTFTVLFRGHQIPEFVAAVEENPSFIEKLYDFAREHTDLLGGSRDYLPTNAARELGRFLSDDALKDDVRPLVRQLLKRGDVTGRTAPMWVGVAEMAQTFDKSNCGYYGTCKLSTRIAAAVGKTDYTCSSSIRIRAQQMTSSEFAATCSSLRSQDAYFHSIARDSGPVANDYNTTIEVVVYNSSYDYQTYAGAEYGINTNNGGMYLEGNPSASGNQARFIAYEAEWARPTFEIWNLNHEYTHYLDGRFNMYGDFSANVSTPTIWWIEGFAEYISYSYRNEPYTAAQTEAAYARYTLRTLFDTTYSHDSTRVYRWGYLAAAFMVNKHPNELSTVLNYYRSGNWSTARAYLTSSIGTRYDGEFRNFLTQCAAGNCGGGGGTPTNTPPSASFNTSVSGLTASFTDTSNDPDGTIASRSWSFGDGTSSTSANPAKTYSAAGSYTVTLTVTDNDGATNSVRKTVTVGGGGSQLPECSDTDVRQLARGCQRSGRAAGAGDNDYLYIYVPSGVAQLRIASQGGTGDADLYYSPSSWATASNYTLSSTAAGNAESITVNNPSAGYHYITLHGRSAFSGVTVSVQ